MSETTATNRRVIVTQLPGSPAQDGTDGNGITPPTGAVGIRGWLSGIFSLLAKGAATVANSLSVTIATNQTKIPVTLQDASGNALSDFETTDSDGEAVKSTPSVLPAEAYLRLFNGTTWDRARGFSNVPKMRQIGMAMRQLPQEIVTVSFCKAAASSMNSADMSQLFNSMAYSQSGGNALIVTGTGTNTEYLARSNVAFWQSILFRWQTTLSQRIANNNFMMLLADKIGDALAVTVNSATSITIAIPGTTWTTADNAGQFVFIGGISGISGAIPGRYAIASVSGNNVTFTVAGWPASGSGTAYVFGWNHAKVLYNSTTATNAAFTTQRQGIAAADTTATINTTASPGHIGQIRHDGRNVTLADMLEASATTPTMVTRGSRVSNITDPDTEMYVYMWAFNGSVAPATTTTWTVGFWAVESFPINPVFLAGSEMLGTAHALAVQLVNNTGLGVVGAAADSSATSGSPVYVAGRVLDALDTTMAANDAAGLPVSINKQLVVAPYGTKGQAWSYAAASGGDCQHNRCKPQSGGCITARIHYPDRGKQRIGNGANGNCD